MFDDQGVSVLDDDFEMNRNALLKDAMFSLTEVELTLVKIIEQIGQGRLSREEWWKRHVPVGVRSDCEILAKKNGKHPWECASLRDIVRILEFNLWHFADKIFADKTNRMEKMHILMFHLYRFIELRNHLSHPRPGLRISEIKEVVNIATDVFRLIPPEYHHSESSVNEIRESRINVAKTFSDIRRSINENRKKLYIKLAFDSGAFDDEETLDLLIQSVHTDAEIINIRHAFYAGQKRREQIFSAFAAGTIADHSKLYYLLESFKSSDMGEELTIFRHAFIAGNKRRDMLIQHYPQNKIEFDIIAFYMLTIKQLLLGRIGWAIETHQEAVMELGSDHKSNYVNLIMDVVETLRNDSDTNDDQFKIYTRFIELAIDFEKRTN